MLADYSQPFRQQPSWGQIKITFVLRQPLLYKPNCIIKTENVTETESNNAQYRSSWAKFCNKNGDLCSLFISH